jgi:cytochrome P450
VISPLTLSTGHILPTGTRFCFPGWAINSAGPSTPSSPSLNIKPPSQFDAFRFSALRSLPGNENKHQFVTISPESVNFGQGSHACPGRFFASNEIKVVLIELLRHWDIRLKGGEGRPKNIYNGLTCGPDTGAEIEFRRRKI